MRVWVQMRVHHVVNWLDVLIGLNVSMLCSELQVSCPVKTWFSSLHSSVYCH